MDVTFEEFAAARLPALLRYAVILTGDRELAQDVVQDVLVRAQLNWKRIEAAGSPDAYIRRMVLNEYLSWRRRWAVRNINTVGERVVDIAETRGAFGDHAEAVVNADDLWGRLSELPRRQRAVLVLRYYEELSDEEIARLFKCSAATVRSHASKALKTLRLHEEKQSVSISGEAS